MNTTDKISVKEIKQRLLPHASHLNIQCRDEVSSTNSILKEDAFGEECVLIALSQTAGKGRLGRSFYSPDDTGLYLSIRLKTRMPTEKLLLITPAAAAAACTALETVGCKNAKIKWVNDILLDEKKICGILTEAVHSPCGETSIIVGIGINVYSPHNGFPQDISTIAGFTFHSSRENLRNELAADFINRFMLYFENIDKCDFIDIYREKSCIVGKKIDVIKSGNIRKAFALDIDENCRLIVQYEDKTTEALYSGEISIRESKD